MKSRCREGVTPPPKRQTSSNVLVDGLAKNHLLVHVNGALLVKQAQMGLRIAISVQGANLVPRVALLCVKIAHQGSSSHEKIAAAQSVKHALLGGDSHSQGNLSV